MLLAHSCTTNIVKSVPDKLLLQIYRVASQITSIEALNCTTKYEGVVPDNLGQRLKQILNRWKADGFNVETGRVDYQRLANSLVFEEFKETVMQLQNFDPASLQTENERKAFWINMYNILLVHGVIVYGAKRSVQDISAPFERMAYVIGGYRFSADDIEHGILRANKGHVAIPGKRFTLNDPRYQYVIERLDPRIHFTLVCASASCPPIDVYQPGYLEKQLDLAASNFINNGGVILDHDAMHASLSKIFMWYASDFGGNWMGFGSKAPVLRYAAQYIESEDDAAFIRENVDRLRVTYQEYDWSLNV